MKLLKLWRTFKEGLKNFYRNGWLSIATGSVMAVSLYIMSLTILIAVGSETAVKNIEERINISVYFKPEVGEDVILGIRDKISSYKEIKSVDYVSKEEALEEFIETSNNDPAIKEALEEIGENPLLPALVIKARDTEDYDLVARAIEQSSYNEYISRINYEKNKSAIEKLTNLIRTMEKIGFALSAIFIAVAILITFNTIRITIYAHRQELEVMRLVGASNMYVRMPHVFEGIFYGLSSATSVLILIYVTFQFIAPLFQKIISREALVSFYFHNFALMLILLVFSGVFFGVVSSLIAIRRYLKV
jgi:cell division transport system permease protein